MLTRTGPENTAFIKEFQRRESKDSISFIKHLPEAQKAQLTGKGGGSVSSGVKLASKPRKSNPQGHMADAELLNHLSMNLWRRINAGYMIESRPCLSLVQASYTWDRSQLEKTNREHMHKKDMFSEYAEAAARFNIMIKSNVNVQVPKYIPRALRPQTPGRKWYAPAMKLPPGYKGPGSLPTVSTTPSTTTTNVSQPSPAPTVQSSSLPLAQAS